MQGEKVILVRYGELHLKGKNRPYFERLLINSMVDALDKYDAKVERMQGRYFVKGFDAEKEDEIINRLTHVFGLHSVSKARKIEKDWEAISQAAIELTKLEMQRLGAENATFKVVAKRADKNYPVSSMQIAADLGGIILENVEGLKVDVKNPEIILSVEIRESAYVYVGEIACSGGLPAGSNGRVALLLSGGIDSPVAGHMMMKRGLGLECIHFHSFPYTSERAKQKVITLAEKLSLYSGRVHLNIIGITELQQEIYKNSPASEGTILLRRAMMQISNRIALNKKCGAIVTGEAIGQVASQTLKSLACTEDGMDMPVFRPLIGFDKIEIIERAKKIDTYETSILPYEDCCTIFTPKKPVIHPKLAQIRKSQAGIERWDELIEEALQNAEVLNVR